MISWTEAAAGNRTGDDVVEIADYDPVRHSVLAIGVKEPSPDVPIHWLAYRTEETVAAAAFVWASERKKGVAYVDGRHPWGSFDEAMALLTLAKSSGGPAGLEGRGYLLRGRTVDELVDSVARISRLNEKKGQGARRKGTRTGRKRPETRKRAKGADS